MFTQSDAGDLVGLVGPYSLTRLHVLQNCLPIDQTDHPSEEARIYTLHVCTTRLFSKTSQEEFEEDTEEKNKHQGKGGGTIMDVHK